MALKSEFCTCECSCTAVIRCCHATCNDGISLVFKSIGQQEFKFSNFVASQCCTSVVIPFDEKFNIWICFVESLKIPWFDIGNTRHQLYFALWQGWDIFWNPFWGNPFFEIMSPFWFVGFGFGHFLVNNFTIWFGLINQWYFISV